MSTNCIRCVTNERTGADLLCDHCRVMGVELLSATAWLAEMESLGRLNRIGKDNYGMIGPRMLQVRERQVWLAALRFADLHPSKIRPAIETISEQVERDNE